MTLDATGLTPDELDLLQTRLVEKMADSGCMPLDTAHGFLSATAASPAGAEQALLEHVLGGLAGDETLRPLLGRFRAQLLIDLEAAEYGPLILQMPRDDGSLLPLPYGWCQGYMAGVEFLGEERRDALLADEQAGALLTPVLSFLMYEEAQWFDPPNEAVHRETVGQLGDVAVALYQWWRRRAA
jgi:yecA family protein